MRTNTPSRSIITFLLSVFFCQMFLGNLGGFGVGRVWQAALALTSVIQFRRPFASPPYLHSALFPPQRRCTLKLSEGRRGSLTTSQMPPGVSYDSYPCNNLVCKYLRCSPILVTLDDPWTWEAPVFHAPLSQVSWLLQTSGVCEWITSRTVEILASLRNTMGTVSHTFWCIIASKWKLITDCTAFLWLHMQKFMEFFLHTSVGN